METPNFFIQEELQLLENLEFKVIDKVLYHYWVNTAQEKLELLDYLEIRYDDGESTIFTAGDDNDGIHFFTGDLNDAKAKKVLDLGKYVHYKTVDMSEQYPWDAALSKPIVGVELQSPDKKNFFSSELVLDFADYRVEIRLAQNIDGLEAEESELI